MYINQKAFTQVGFGAILADPNNTIPTKEKPELEVLAGELLTRHDTIQISTRADYNDYKNVIFANVQEGVGENIKFFKGLNFQHLFNNIKNDVIGDDGLITELPAENS